MTNKDKQKRRLQKSMAQRGKEIEQRHREMEIARTNKALMNYFRKVGVIHGKGA